MSKKRLLAMGFTLLVTTILVFAFLSVGGSDAVTALIAVLGFLLAIVQFYFALPKEQEQNNASREQLKLRSFYDEGKSASSLGGMPSSMFMRTEENERFRRSKFVRREEDDWQS